MSDDFELCIARISQCELSDHQLAIVNNLSLLISVREGDHLLLGFTSYEIAELINELANGNYVISLYNNCQYIFFLLFV